MLSHDADILHMKLLMGFCYRGVPFTAGVEAGGRSIILIPPLRI